MDEKGFVFTFDAILALLPLIIVLSIICSIPAHEQPTFYDKTSHEAQDILEIMACEDIAGDSILNDMAIILKTQENNSSSIKECQQIAGPFLDKQLQDKDYQLSEISELNGTIICSGGNLNYCADVSVARRSYSNYTFQLSIGHH